MQSFLSKCSRFRLRQELNNYPNVHPFGLNRQLQVTAYHLPVPEPADPSSVPIFIQMFESRVMWIWVVSDISVFFFGFSFDRKCWGLSWYIFNNEHAHGAQSIFMLTGKFCKFVLGFYSIKYWMDLHELFCSVIYIFEGEKSTFLLQKVV